MFNRVFLLGINFRLILYFIRHIHLLIGNVLFNNNRLFPGQQSIIRIRRICQLLHGYLIGTRHNILLVNDTVHIIIRPDRGIAVRIFYCYRKRYMCHQFVRLTVDKLYLQILLYGSQIERNGDMTIVIIFIIFFTSVICIGSFKLGCFLL